MQRTRNPTAGGFFIFVGTVAGIALGIRYHQLAIGMFGGFAAGLALSLIVWLIDRSRA